LQAVLILHGHYWLDWDSDYGYGPFKVKHLAVTDSYYSLVWDWDKILNWHAADPSNPKYQNLFPDFFTLPDKYKGWKTGLNYGL
jgi:hypothetical protein